MPRVEELIKREITSILQKDLCLPGLGFMTLTRVVVSKDLHTAKIFVSVYGSKEIQKKTLDDLNEASGSIHHILKPRLRIKYVPNLKFIPDHSAEYSDHISRRLMEIKKLDQDKEKDSNRE